MKELFPEKQERKDVIRSDDIVWLSINARYSHTSLAIRYLREAVPGSRILELTINDPLLSILSAIYESRSRLLGIACYIWNIELVKDLLQLLAAAMPECVLVCGGPEVSYGTTAFLRAFPMVSYVVRGEGEEAVSELCARLADGRTAHDVPGIAWREGDSVHDGTAVTVSALRHLPFPYRQQELATLGERILYYETSRGCPFSCAYCLSCATAGVRYLPLERVKRELSLFVQANVRQVKFVDRTFNAKKSHFLPILRWMASLPATCRTNFHFEVAIDYLDEEALAILARLPRGRVQLEIGIQSTNAATLAAVSRINHWERIANNIQRIRSYHTIHLHVDLIIGLPEEDIASLHRSFNDIYALRPDMLQIGFLKFLKGAKMMELASRYHYKYMAMAPYEVLSNDSLTYGEIRLLHILEDVFELYYNAGRCRRSIEWLIRMQEQGDAFVFWRRFSSWWEAHGYHRIRHAPKNLYVYLLTFAISSYCLTQGRRQAVEALLRLDALAKDFHIRPLGLDWNDEKYQTRIAAFWHSDLPKKWIPAFTFQNWREIRRKYHIEVFPLDVLQLAQSKTDVEGTIGETTILFCKAEQNIQYERIFLPVL